MDWLRLAFGLIREAVNTEESTERREPTPPPPQSTDFAGLLAEHRRQVERNLETVVQMLNAQNEKLAETNRRQRIWNIALAASIGITFLIALLALIYGM